MLTKPDIEALLSEAEALPSRRMRGLVGLVDAFDYALTLVERLTAALREQAGEVERLRLRAEAAETLLAGAELSVSAKAALLAECREAIEPFAKVAGTWAEGALDPSYFRKAAALHTKLKEALK